MSVRPKFAQNLVCQTKSLAFLAMRFSVGWLVVASPFVWGGLRTPNGLLKGWLLEMWSLGQRNLGMRNLGMQSLGIDGVSR